MKKICFFTNSMFKLGGEQRITTKIANGLIEKGYDVSILIKQKEEIDLKLLGLSEKVHITFLDVNYDFRLNNTKIFEKLRIINRKTGIFYFFPRLIRHFFCSNRMLKQVSTYFKNNHFDYVIGVAGDRSFILGLLKPIIKGKIIFWNHQSIEAHFKRKNARYVKEERFIKPLLKKFDEIIVLTQNDKKLLDSYYKLNCKVIPNCKSFETKKKSSLTHKKFLAIGRLTYQKGFDYLLQAMTLFSKQNKEWTLDIYGEGENKEDLLKMIQKNNLENRVHIHPINKDIINIYLNHDVFLMSSRYEGFGLVTLEAMECGLPVIGFDIPANKELILDQVNGLLVPSYDVIAFSNAMKKLATNKEIREKYALELKKSTEKFTLKNIVNQWEELLK